MRYSSNKKVVTYTLNIRGVHISNHLTGALERDSNSVVADISGDTRMLYSMLRNIVEERGQMGVKVLLVSNIIKNCAKSFSCNAKAALYFKCFSFHQVYKEENWNLKHCTKSLIFFLLNPIFSTPKLLISYFQ